MEELKAGKWLIQITGSEQGFREKKKVAAVLFEGLDKTILKAEVPVRRSK